MPIKADEIERQLASIRLIVFDLWRTMYGPDCKCISCQVQARGYLDAMRTELDELIGAVRGMNPPEKTKK